MKTFCQHPACFLGIILIFAVSLLSQSRAQDNDIIRIAVATPAKTTDPALAADAASARIIQLTHPALLQWDKSYKPVGLVAKSCMAESLVKVKCQLPVGKTFTNGQPLTAQAVKAWLENIQNNARSPVSSRLKHISITVPEPHVVEFALPSPTQTFLGMLTEIPIADPTQTSAGAGPYMLETSSTTGAIILRPNRNNIPTLVLEPLADATTRMLKLRKHEVDVVWNDIPPTITRYAIKNAAENGWTVMSHPSNSYSYIALNFQNPALASPAVREALSLALNRPLIRKALLADQGAPATSLLPLGHPSAWNAPEDIYDPMSAEALLDETQLENGQILMRGPDNMRVSLTLKTSTDPLSQRLAQALQAEWQEIGIDVKLEPTEWGAFFTSIQKGQFDMALMTWTGEQQPAFYHQLFHSRMGPPEGFNRGHVKDARIDNLTEQILQAKTDEESRSLAIQLQQYLAEARPYLPLYRRHHGVVMGRGVGGCILDAAGSYRGLMACQKRND